MAGEISFDFNDFDDIINAEAVSVQRPLVTMDLDKENDASIVVAYLVKNGFPVDLFKPFMDHFSDDPSRILDFCKLVQDNFKGFTDFKPVWAQVSVIVGACDKVQIEERLRTVVRSKRFVDPFNYTGRLLVHPAFKVGGGRTDRICVSLRGIEYEIPLGTRQAMFKTISELLVKANAYLTKEEFVALPYDATIIKMSITLAMFYEANVEGGLLVMKKRPDWTAPEMFEDVETGKSLRDSNQKFINALCKMAETLKGAINGIPFDYEGESISLVSVYYRALISVRQKITLGGFTTAYQKAQATYSKRVVTDVPVDILKRYYAKLSDGEDPLILMYHDSVTSRQKWRIPLGSYGNLAVENAVSGPIGTITGPVWDAFPLVDTLLDLPNYFSDSSLDIDAVIVDGGSIKSTARALRVVAKNTQNYLVKNSKHVETYVKTETNEGTVSKGQVLIESPMSIIDQNKTKTFLYINQSLRDYGGGTDKDDLAIRNLLQQLKKNQFKGTAIISYTLPNAGKFTGILNDAEDNGFNFSIKRHPRLYSEAFYFVFSNITTFKKKSRLAMNMLRLQWAYQVIQNTAVIDMAMFTGIDIDLLGGGSETRRAFCLSLAVASINKGLSKAALRAQIQFTDNLPSKIDDMMTDEDIKKAMGETVRFNPDIAPSDISSSDNNNNNNSGGASEIRSPPTKINRTEDSVPSESSTTFVPPEFDTTGDATMGGEEYDDTTENMQQDTQMPGDLKPRAKRGNELDQPRKTRSSGRKP